jgi:hypothetical protein
MLIESWSYHAMGPCILMLLVLTLVYSLCPPVLREPLARRLAAHGPAWNALYWIFVVLFVGYGTARAAHCIMMGK